MRRLLLLHLLLAAPLTRADDLVLAHCRLESTKQRDLSATVFLTQDPDHKESGKVRIEFTTLDKKTGAAGRGAFDDLAYGSISAITVKHFQPIGFPRELLFVSVPYGEVISRVYDFDGEALHILYRETGSRTYTDVVKDVDGRPCIEESWRQDWFEETENLGPGYKAPDGGVLRYVRWNGKTFAEDKTETKLLPLSRLTKALAKPTSVPAAAKRSGLSPDELTKLLQTSGVAKIHYPITGGAAMYAHWSFAIFREKEQRIRDVFILLILQDPERLYGAWWEESDPDVRMVLTVAILCEKNDRAQHDSRELLLYAPRFARPEKEHRLEEIRTAMKYRDEFGVVIADQLQQISKETPWRLFNPRGTSK